MKNSKRNFSVINPIATETWAKRMKIEGSGIMLL